MKQKNDDFEELKRNPKFQGFMELLRHHSPEKVEEILDQMSMLPPRPPKVGKKYVVSKQGVNAMVDPELIKFLEETRQSLGITMSRMVEACVWEYFNRPPLSFEQTAGESGPEQP